MKRLGATIIAIGALAGGLAPAAGGQSDPCPGKFALTISAPYYGADRDGDGMQCFTTTNNPNSSSSGEVYHDDVIHEH
jgi:hypothetical protein